MSDYTELKRLAEAAQYENCEFQHELVAATKAFFVGCIPEQILALIADLDEARNGMKHSCAIRLKKEIERLKDENKALLKALDVAAARMLAAKVCFDRDYPGEWSGELHLAVAIKEIDAAMGKGEQS